MKTFLSKAPTRNCNREFLYFIKQGRTDYESEMGKLPEAKRRAVEGGYADFWDRRSFVKIGTSKNPSKRVLQLQTGNPYGLELLGWLEDGKVLEKPAHSHFFDKKYGVSAHHTSCSCSRIRNTEWFKYTYCMEKFLSNMLMHPYSEI